LLERKKSLNEGPLVLNRGYLNSLLKKERKRKIVCVFVFFPLWMAFNLAETSATLTAAVSVAESNRTGLSHEEFLNEWNWCWIAQGKQQKYVFSFQNL
jgi:hypothetical protein